MKLSLSILLATITASVTAFTAPTCSENSHCPEDYPCCSNDGTCGTGSYCLGPCDPRYSFNLTSCMPAPVCKSGTFKPRADNMMEQVKYLGNTTDLDFIYYGEVANDDDDDYLLVKMPKNSVGSVVSSTFYVWYGKVSIRLKSAHYAGVVSSAIMFSQVQDEIDYEFVGNDLDVAQSNFYFESQLNYTNSVHIDTTDTYENWHTYEFDWTEDQITWSIDGVSYRTLEKSSTYNSTSGDYQFPQTPARIQVSIWPGGASSNAEGTVEWAGGAIDWDESDFTDPGYVYVGLDTVEVECYDPPSGTTISGNTSYIYSNGDWTEKGVEISDKLTWMKNLGNTGFYTGEEEVLEAESSSAKSKSSKRSFSSSSSSSSSSSKSSRPSKVSSSSKIPSSSKVSSSSRIFSSSTKIPSSSKVSSSSRVFSSSRIPSFSSSSKSSTSSTPSSTFIKSETLISTEPKEISSAPLTTASPTSTTPISTSSSFSSSSSTSSGESDFIQNINSSSSISNMTNISPKNEFSLVAVLFMVASYIYLI